MRAGIEEFAKVFSGGREHAGIGHAEAIEAERGGFARQRTLQIGRRQACGRVQKSRST
jgi:hypothetical protein